MKPAQIALLAMVLGLPRASAAGPARKDQSVEKRKATARQLWKIGLRYFAAGDADLAHVQWSACGEMDPGNEDCRQALAGLDKLAKVPTSGEAAAEHPASAAPMLGAPDLLEDRQARRQEAIRHWNAGILHYQNGEYVKARDEWALCGLLDPKNTDCPAGLERVAQNLAKAAAGGYGEANPRVQSPSEARETAGPVSAPPTPQASEAQSQDQARQEAVRHWNAGITYFQSGNYAKAKEEWLLCRKSDAANLDCQTGLQRVDRAYGGAR